MSILFFPFFPSFMYNVGHVQIKQAQFSRSKTMKKLFYELSKGISTYMIKLRFIPLKMK